jgi:hypothetical protein
MTKRDDDINLALETFRNVAQKGLTDQARINAASGLVQIATQLPRGAYNDDPLAPPVEFFDPQSAAFKNAHS